MTGDSGPKGSAATSPFPRDRCRALGRQPLPFAAVPAAMLGMLLPWAVAGAAAPDPHRPIRVLNPRRLAVSEIPARRTPLGIPEDYKPWIVRLRDDSLLIVAFHAGRDPVREYAVFWRSTDGGRTWGPREPRPDISGREFAATCLSDGTLLMTCHLLAQDASNDDGYTYSKLWRSADNGKSWTSRRIGPQGFPERGQTNTDRTVLEMPDPDGSGKPIAWLGVSLAGARKDSAEYVFLWRSFDSGRSWHTWCRPETGGWDDYDGFFGQSTTHRTPSGKLLHVVRVDRRGRYWRIPGATLSREQGDQGDRMMLWESRDHGRSWCRAGKDGRFGTYGEMYPRFLQLSDGRLLLTFTVRSNSTDGAALGLRAVLSDAEGSTWDFRHDRLVIDDANQPPGTRSGGGFGNTVQCKDGTLISVYSYRGEDGRTHVEACRWRLPPLPDEPTRR